MSAKYQIKHASACSRSLWAAIATAVAVLVYCAPAQADDWTNGKIGEDIFVTAILGVDSVSAFRGVKSTKLNPSVYANLEIERGEVYGGIFTNPTSIKGEVRPLVVTYLNYAPDTGPFKPTIGARYYAFVASSDFGFDLNGDGVDDHVGRKGFFEAYAALSRNIGKLNLRTQAYYAPDVFGETGGSLYVKTRVKVPVGHGFSVQADFGVSEFERDQFNDDYVDYGVSVYKSVKGFDLYLRYSDTSGLAGSDDRLLAFGIEKSWNVAATDKKRAYLRRKIRNPDWRGGKEIFGFQSITRY